MNKNDYLNFVRNNVIESDISYRGGNLKVNASELFPNVRNAVVGAYQNYLGGGIAGRIVGAAMFDPSVLNKRDRARFEKLLKACVAHFHELNNGGGDEYFQTTPYATLEGNRCLPVSGY